LFEEKWNFLFSALTEDFSNPLDVHRARMRTRLAADNHPLNIPQVDASE
jgi:hypothetical protein